MLKLLQETYLSKIKMIYIDPPYNTGNDFVYEDDFAQSTEEYLENSGQFDEDGNRMVQNTESNGRFHTDWLNMIYPRLKLAKALLTDDGVIFISIDDNELENIKKCCEEVFGESNFLANIVWKHTQQSKNDEPHFSRQYNHTLVYAKMKSSLPNFYFKRTEEDNKNYSNPDADPKGMWRSGDVRSPNYRKTLRYTITAPNGNIIQPPTNGWRWSEESLRDKISTGEIKFKSDNSGIIRKIYLCDQPGRTPENLWEDQFKDYQLALYTLAFSSFLDVMLVGNYGKEYLSGISEKLDDYSMKYRELYTQCYEEISGYSSTSIQSSLLKGLSKTTKAVGKIVERIPVVGDTQADEMLIAAGEKLSDIGTEKIRKQMRQLIERQSNFVRPFIDNIDTVNRLNNNPVQLLVDKDNLYIATIA